MQKLPEAKGVFSGKDLPTGWSNEDSLYKSYAPLVSEILPDSKIISPISRGTSTVTFVLRTGDELQVCQFDSTGGGSGSRRYPKIENRIRYLKTEGIKLPDVVSTGLVEHDNQPKEYIVTRFISGLGADKFLKSHPEKTYGLYHKVGEELAKLAAVPVIDDDSDSQQHAIDAVVMANDSLLRLELFSQDQLDSMVGNIKKRFSLLPSSQLAHVHLDPFPSNVMVSGPIDNFEVSLLDIESIDLGHPLVEGLGRAVKWGIYDWAYISNSDPKLIPTAVEAILTGYSRVDTSARIFLEDPSLLRLLLDTSELIGLPTSIAREGRKQNPAEYQAWNIGRLLQLSNMPLD